MRTVTPGACVPSGSTGSTTAEARHLVNGKKKVRVLEDLDCRGTPSRGSAFCEICDGACVRACVWRRGSEVREGGGGQCYCYSVVWPSWADLLLFVGHCVYVQYMERHTATMRALRRRKTLFRKFKAG